MMQGTYYKEWSRMLGREMEFKVYGTAGVPVLALPAQYRMAVHLYYYEELSVAEIAAVLGKSEGAVKSRLFRARALLRRYLKEDDDVSERL